MHETSIVSEIWFKTEVIEIKTGKKRVYYIRNWEEKLNVGHGMCSGAFTFSSESKYKVRFTPTNTEGDTLKTTDWVIFNSPFVDNNGPFGN